MSHGLAATVVAAGYIRVEGREHSVRIVSVEPDVPVEVRLEHMGFVAWGRRVVLYPVICQAVK